MILIVLTIALVLFPRPATEVLHRWTGTRSWSTASRSATVRALTLLVALWLLYTLNPEVRVFLLAVDFIGVDIFLMLLFFQSQGVLTCVNIATRAAVRALENWSLWRLFPMPIPHTRQLKQHPLWSLYATARLFAVAFLAVMPVAVVVKIALKKVLT